MRSGDTSRKPIHDAMHPKESHSGTNRKPTDSDKNNDPPDISLLTEDSLKNDISALTISDISKDFLLNGTESNIGPFLDAEVHLYYNDDDLSLVDKLVSLMTILPGSMISHMLPIINRYSLRTVSVNYLLSNQKLRHRFLFSDDLIFKPIESIQEIIREEEYWKYIKKELDWLKEWQINRHRPESMYQEFYEISLIYIPLLLNEVREILSGIVYQNKQRFPAYELLNTEKIIECLDHGAVLPFESILPPLISNLYACLKIISNKNGPIVNGVSAYTILTRLHNLSFDMPVDSDDIVCYLRTLLDVIEAIKLESVNVHLRTHRKIMIDLITKYEYDAIVSKDTPKLCSTLKSISLEMKDAEVEDIFYEMVWKISIAHIDLRDIPETFHEDISLFKMVEQSLDLILRIFIFLLCLKEKLGTEMNIEFINCIADPDGFFIKTLSGSITEEKNSLQNRSFSSLKCESILFYSVVDILKQYNIEIANENDIKVAISTSLTYFCPIHHPRLFAIGKLRLKQSFLGFLKGVPFKAGQRGKILDSVQPLLKAHMPQFKTVLDYNFTTFKEFYSKLIKNINNNMN